MTPQEWDAYLLGLEAGIARGYAAAMADHLDDLKRAGRELAEWMPAVRRQIDARAAREKRGLAA